MWALHGYLAPSGRVVTKSTDGKKNVKKYSISDSQDAFIKRLDDCQSAENYIKELKLQGKPIQPFLIIVSPHIGKCGDTYIYFDKVKYAFKSFARAVDILFKIFHVFNIKYPQQCEVFWQFVEIFFFEISTESTHSRVQILVEELKNCN